VADVITCPVCGVDAEPAAQVGLVRVCGHCGASLLLEPDKPIRRATGNDLAGLSAVDLRTLQRARARLARPERLV
jgi:hypothetical protein